MADKPGYVDGKHFTEYVETVKQLKREKQYEKAAALLNRLIGATEAQDAAEGFGAAPGYYEQAAIVYRKLGDVENEIAVLERWARYPHRHVGTYTVLHDRLKKLRQKHGR